MSLLRFVARSMFSSYFVVDGVAAITRPEARAAEAEGFTDKAVPLVQRAVPASYSSSVPEQAETWVRLAGVGKVLGGVMFATGIGRRLGAGLLAAASILDVAVAWPSEDLPKEAQKEARSNALKHVALLGAAVIATQDLQGRPSLGWRAEQRAKLASKRAEQIGDKAGKKAQQLSKKASKQAKQANKQLSKFKQEVTR